MLRDHRNKVVEQMTAVKSKSERYKMNYRKYVYVFVSCVLLGFFLSYCSGTSEVSKTRSTRDVEDLDTNTTRDKTDSKAVRIARPVPPSAARDTSQSAPEKTPKTDGASRQLAPPSQIVIGDRPDNDANQPQTDPLKGFEFLDILGCVVDTDPASSTWNPVVRLKSRDTVLAWCNDYLEGEPTTPFFLLLDAPTGTVVRRDAWAAVFTHDNEKLIYGRPTLLDEELNGQYFDDTRAMLKHNARKLKVPLQGLDDAIVAHGCLEGTYVVQPVVRDMRKGTEKILPIVGGGALGRMGRDIIGLPKPLFYEFPPDWYSSLVSKNRPQKLDVENGRRLPIEKIMHDKAIDALKGPSPLYTYIDCKSPADLKNGDVLLTTRDKTLGLVVLTLSSQTTIRGARLPEGWSGDVLCP